MNNFAMRSPTFSEVLRALCQQDERIPKKSGGEIHATDAAKALGINQPTLTRMLSGQTDRPSPTNAQKLKWFFNVTRDQLEGLEEIPGLFETSDYQYPFPSIMRPSPEGVAESQRQNPLEIAQLFTGLSTDDRRWMFDRLSQKVSAKEAAWIAALFSARAQQLLEQDES